jgi:TRAP-type mannitol/chloroaromatic compound transport system substrate-binding protein
MTNVFMPTGEVYEGFQRGVIDCAVITPTFYVPAGLWEVAKYYLPAGFSPTGGAGYIMNKDTWEGLPQVAQQIIFDEIPAWLARDAKGLMRNVQIWGTDGPDKHGVEFVDPTSYSQIITEQQDKVINGLLDNPPAGVADPKASLAKYKEILAGWGQTLEGLGYNMSNNPTVEEIQQAYVAGPDSVDWDAYTAALTKALAPFRP